MAKVIEKRRCVSGEFHTRTMPSLAAHATTSAAAGGISTALTSTHLASNSAAATLISTYLPAGVTVTVESVTQPTTSTASSPDELPIAAIIGGAAGLVVIVGAIAYFRRRSKPKTPAPHSDTIANRTPAPEGKGVTPQTTAV